MSFVWSVLLASSPSGKLVQIEYALQAVAAGAPSVGIKAKNGVVLAVEKKQKSVLYDESSICKVCVHVYMCTCFLLWSIITKRECLCNWRPFPTVNF